MPKKKTMSLGLDAAALAAEASTVIGLRMAQAALAGPGASKESWRMWNEKVVALNGLYWKMIAGGWGMSPEAAARTTMRHYLPLVRANRRRLTRTSKSRRGAEHLAQ